MSDPNGSFTVLHGSDLHFGRPHAPAAAADFLSLAHATSPDLIALSGDFTQRAKNREYEAASAYLKRLPQVPLVVTPGNHDVPLYRIRERASAPFRNYRRWIADELDSEHHVDGAVVVAMNTTTPERAIVNGNLDDRQLERAAAAFARAGNGGLRALVVHHALVGAPGGDRIATLPRARRIVRRLAEMGVELVLFGHLHRAFVSVGTPNGRRVGSGERRADGPAGRARGRMAALLGGWTPRGAAIPRGRDTVPAPDGPRPSARGTAGRDAPVLLVCSGTTASDRGRGSEKGKNSCNLVQVTENRILVTRYLRSSSAEGFRPVARETFPRRGAPRPRSPRVASGA